MPEKKLAVGDRVVVRVTKNTVIDRKALVDPTCRICQAPAKSLCSRCNLVRYCGRECQTEDWKKGHKEVCKQGRASKDIWDGMHGCVVSEADEEDMVTVDLDLLPTGQASHVTVGIESLDREGKIMGTYRRADVKGGSLVEGEGRSISMALSLTRFVTATQVKGLYEAFPSLREVEMLPSMGPKGFMLQSDLTSTAWSTWGQARGNDVKPTKELLREYLFDELLPCNPDWKKDKVMKDMVEAMDCPSAVLGWNCRVHGTFWVCGMDENGTYLGKCEWESEERFTSGCHHLTRVTSP